MAENFQTFQKNGYLYLAWVDNSFLLWRHPKKCLVSVLRPCHFKTKKMQKNDLGVQPAISNKNKWKDTVKWGEVDKRGAKLIEATNCTYLVNSNDMTHGICFLVCSLVFWMCIFMVFWSTTNDYFKIRRFWSFLNFPCTLRHKCAYEWMNIIFFTNNKSTIIAVINIKLHIIGKEKDPNSKS